LPSVIQAVRPFMSAEDIDKGARWSIDIAKELESSSFGILCVTPDNVDSSWLNFEAGALSKALDASRVTPLLFGVRPTDLQGPLGQFQATRSDQDDIWKLVRSVNRHCSPIMLEEDRLREAFDKWWPGLEAQLKILANEPRVAHPSPVDTSAVLQEMLVLIRSQQQMLATMAADSAERALGTARDGGRLTVRKDGTGFQVEHHRAGGDAAVIRADGIEDVRKLLSHRGISSGMFEYAIKRLTQCEDGGGVFFDLFRDGPVVRNLVTQN